MSEKKHIDDFFKERLSHEPAPLPEMAWQNIEARLLAKKEKRRVIPFWWKLTGIAAILILGFVLMGPYFGGAPKRENPSGNNNPIVSSENPKQSNADQTPAAGNEEPGGATASENSNVPGDRSAGAAAKQKTAIVSNTAVPDKDSRQNVAVSQSEKNNKQRIGNTVGASNTRQAVASSGTEEALRKKRPGTGEQLASKGPGPKTNDGQPANAPNKKPITDKTATLPKEGQDAVVNQDAPVKNTENTTNDKRIAANSETLKDKKTTGSTINTTDAPQEIKKKDSTNLAVAEPNALEELLNEKEEKIAKERKENRWQVTPNIAPIYFSSTSNGSPLDEKLAANEKTYGTNYSYGVGVNYALNKKLSIRSGVNSFTTDYDTNEIVFYQNANASRMQNVNPTLQGSLIQIDPLANVNFSFGRLVQEKFEGTLNQRTGYIEMPVEVSYKLVSRKFGVDLIGGFSTLFLTQNDVYLRTPGINMKIGEASNLNDIHFSTNIGLGLKYNFLKRFDARVEPLFKYQLNTYSSGAGGFKPYIFGIYSGISYHF